jgi:hypothetical protein
MDIKCDTNTLTDSRATGRVSPRHNRPFQQQSRVPPNNQPFDSNGSGVRIRGNAFQIYERYLALAREAATSDGRIAAENFYQHAGAFISASTAPAALAVRKKHHPQ